MKWPIHGIPVKKELTPKERREQFPDHPTLKEKKK